MSLSVREFADSLLKNSMVVIKSQITSFRNSPEADIRNPVRLKYSLIVPGSRLAPRFAGLGRDDES